MPKTPDIYDELEVSDSMAEVGLSTIEEHLPVITYDTMRDVYRAMVAVEHAERKGGMN